MTNQSQKDIIIEKLRKDRMVTRNWALKGCITRLSAIINDLNNDGWYIVGKNWNTLNGKDYAYIVKRLPEDNKF